MQQTTSRMYLQKYEVENIVANGEIAHYEHFFLLPQLFQKSSTAEASESGYIWERVKLDR